MKEAFAAWSVRITATFAALLLIYVLTAPPIMMSIARHRGAASFPTIYEPILRVIESDFNGPLLWYFNDVWHSEILLIGENDSSPFAVAAIYVLAGITLTGAMAWPLMLKRFHATSSQSA